MSVSGTTGASWAVAQYAMQTKNATNTKSNTANQSTQAQASEVKVGDAFALNLSPEAQQVAKQSKDVPVEESGAKETKGLSTEEVNALKEDLAAQEQTMLNIMIQALTDSNNKLQSWLDEGVGILNFDGVQIDAARFRR